MAKKNIVLMADSAELSVGRRASTVLYGALDIDWECTSELDAGVDEQLPTVVSPNMQAGYYYADFYPWQERVSAYDIGFSRCDINTKIKYKTSQLAGGAIVYAELEDWDDTTFPRIFARQYKRLDGGIFFDHEFSEDEVLGGTPGDDFTVGDSVTVMLWGQVILELPVVKIALVSDESSLRRWRIQLGGRAVRDAEALREQNEKVWQAIAQERLRSDQLYARRA